MALSPPFQLLILVILALLALHAGAVKPSAQTLSPLPGSFVMPWFCLERCNFTQPEILQQAADVVNAARNGSIGYEVVAFERYNLGANASLVLNADLFDLNAHLRQKYPAFRAKRIAMISSFPYPPQFLSWMRELFANPSPFISALRSELAANAIDGVNVDFEPTSTDATDGDGLKYAAFLGQLKEALAADGRFVTVAASTWSRIWNITAIAVALGPKQGDTSSAVGYATMMNTYTYVQETFERQLDIDLAVFTGRANGRGELAVGMQTWPLAEMSDAALASHFATLAERGVCRIAVWDTPIPARWVPHLEQLTRRCAGKAPA